MYIVTLTGVTKGKKHAASKPILKIQNICGEGKDKGTKHRWNRKVSKMIDLPNYILIITLNICCINN